MQNSYDDIKQVFKDKGFTLLSKEYTTCKLPLDYEKDGYKFCSSYNAFIKTQNPKKWGMNNPYSLENLALFLKNEGATCEVVSTKYDYENILLKCECGNVYNIAINNLLHRKQYACPQCGSKRGGLKHRQDEKYLPLLKEKNLTLLEEYRGSKYFHWMATKEGYRTRTSLYNLSRNINYYDFVFDKDNPYALENIKLRLKINGNRIYFADTEFRGSKVRHKFKCSCGEEFETTWQYIYLNDISRCPTCTHRASSLEVKIKEWLNLNGINYVTEKTFEDCISKNRLRYDFYLPQYNALIEADGEQHFRPVGFGGVSPEEAQSRFKTTKANDLIKDSYAKEKGYSLLRIPYYEFYSEKYKETLTTFMAKI